MTRQTTLDPFRLVGSLLGKYRLLEFIGVGGMGAVYKAQHVDLNDEVALKILKPDLVLESRRLGANLQKLFVEEARNTRRLRHPNIVSVMYCEIDADHAFLVMEWLDGQTLEDVVDKKKVLPPDRLSFFLGQICDGMSYAHHMGIIHRDLKPSNIMIVKDYRSNEVVKILDFGIGKALTSTFHINTHIIGAPYYAAPEQLQVGAKIDYRADVYSLGVMTYQLLTGSLPFSSDSIGALVNLHLQQPPKPLSQIRPEISPAVEEVVLKALAKNPADRYQNVDDLARAFSKAVSLETGLVRIRCVDAASGWPLRGAVVFFDGIQAGETDENGAWNRPNVMPRSHRIEVECPGYIRWESRFNAVAREETELDVRLEAKNSGDLIIKAARGKARSPIAGLPIRLNGGAAGVTDSQGVLHLKELPPGNCVVDIDHRSLKLTSKLEITRGRVSHLEFAFPKRRSYQAWLLVVIVCLVGAGAFFLTKEIIRSRQAALVAAEVKPEPTPAPAANDWLKELGDRRARVTLSELPKLIADFKAAEQSYPSDYRFTYERAKLTLLGTGPSQYESFKLLLAAAEKAIDSGEMSQMASRLKQDQDKVFRPLFEGLNQWPVLQLALRGGDKATITRITADPSKLLEDLNGQWEGVSTEVEEEATLTIQKWDGDTFSGEHVQGTIRVAISGKVNAKTREVTFTDKNAFNELGVNKGSISDDWQSMSWEGEYVEGGTWTWEYRKKSLSPPKPRPTGSPQTK